MLLAVAGGLQENRCEAEEDESCAKLRASWLHPVRQCDKMLAVEVEKMTGRTYQRSNAVASTE